MVEVFAYKNEKNFHFMRKTALLIYIDLKRYEMGRRGEDGVGMILACPPQNRL